MLSSKAKGVSPQELKTPANSIVLKSSFEGLPKYIAYKAALLREKMILTYVIAIMGFLFLSYFIVSRIEIAHLYSELRTKEFILAPGVRDFTPVSPQSIPDSYVHDAVTDFLSSLGNTNASTIVEEYSGLKRFMSDKFRIQFDVETREWINKVKEEDLAQIFHVKEKEIVADEEGDFEVTAFIRADFYAAGQYLGNEDQVVEMHLKLVPPDTTKRWFLQIENLRWSKLEKFKVKAEYKERAKEGGPL